MLTPYRRHVETCAHRAKGQHFTLCSCPIWAYGKVHGEPFRRSLGTNQWDRALRRIQILIQGDELAPALPDSSPALPVAIKNFLEAAHARNLKASTIASYEISLAHLAKHLRSVRIDRIDAALLDRYRAGRQIAATTWRKELGALRTFFGWCLERKWIADNPARRLRMPRVEGLITLPFSDDDVTRLLAAADQIASDNTEETPYIRQRAKALVLALLYSGLRISDVTRLRRTALDETTGHLTLKVLKTGVPLKVLLHRDAIRALQSLPAINPEYYFWSGRGDPVICTKNLRRTVRRLGAIAKVTARPHRFRDTFAVELLTNGVDIRTVQLLLGHKSVRTTEKHYAHFVAAHQALLDSAVSTLNFEPKTARPLLMKPRQDRRRNP